MYLLTQTEVAEKLGISKQYIHYLIKSEKVKKYSDTAIGSSKQDYIRVDYYEVEDFLHKKEKQKDTIDYELYDTLKDEFHRENYFKEWKLQNISKDKFSDFIINNFYEFYIDYTDIKVIENIMIIGSLIYYYQFSYEQKPTKEDAKEFTNKMTNDKKKIINQANALITSLDPVYASSLIESLEKLKNNPFAFIKLPEHIPDGRISKDQLADDIKMITAPKDSLLLRLKKNYKKYNIKLDKDEKYSHNYKIDKILKKLPFKA